ncbi:gamma-tubulin complex component 4 homolog isoform X2 [Drosophila ficusphila]|uniref:gamma-tubulin complex component 4 homolog isoform X2 n=1 Tax=Drosophila ficusphila TaxID=30025 RepID=UPI0007E6098D|nr:gamma-tubulin complex component 4 homolog isoform X2 [Drosophila ficusphila]
MIHDLILACLSHDLEGLGIKAFEDTTAIDEFIHPCERHILLDILKIIKVYHEVVEFAESSGSSKCNSGETQDPSPGYYMLNLSKGIQSALEDYYEEIFQLVSYCQDNERKSLSYIHDALQVKLPVLFCLRTLTMEIQVRKLRGCSMLYYLLQRSEHGDIQLEKVLKKVMQPVKYAFFAGLAHWLLFGVIDDVHSEFFIKYTPTDSEDSKSCKSASSSFVGADKTPEDYIWQYEINMDQLPGFLSIIVAEKVLFVGQTVLVFKMRGNVKTKSKTDPLAVKLAEMSRDDIYELWSGRESEFFKMVEDLNNDDTINVFRVENAINDIKKYVSMRLSELAVNEVDLERQMGLVKDFFLLGRGEFYLEFCSQLIGTMETYREERFKNITRSFELAATVMGITDDLEKFSLTYQRISGEPEETSDFHILQGLTLKYTYEWPLNLLFSPKAIERYNKIFRFLLIIRTFQYEIQRVWAKQTWKAKTERIALNNKIVNLRNHLMFFLNNMQYYIQVDVLESQFGILLNVIKSKADFEEIQRAHTIFLANVLSQCFLLTDSKEGQMNITGCQPQNPIYGTLLKLFGICERFAHITQVENPPDDFMAEIDSLNERFGVQIASLIKLLVDVKTTSCLGPLSQLLLRLDFNHWFSGKQNLSEESIFP